MEKKVKESDLQAKLTKRLHEDIEIARGGVVFKFTELIKSGVPDLAITVGGTSWWELKLARPKIEQTELQHVRMRQLASKGIAWYLVWEETNFGRRTCFVRPKDVGSNGYFTVQPFKLNAGFSGYEAEGWDTYPTLVLPFILQEHGWPAVAGDL